MKKVLIVDDIKGWIDYHTHIVSSLFPDAIIEHALSAREGYDKLLEYNEKPFDIILTDMQMENDFEPKYAGEWFIKQIKTYKEYSDTKIIIVSAAPDIRRIAEKYEVNYIPKGMCQLVDSYKEMFEI